MWCVFMCLVQGPTRLQPSRVIRGCSSTAQQQTFSHDCRACCAVTGTLHKADDAAAFTFTHTCCQALIIIIIIIMQTYCIYFIEDSLCVCTAHQLSKNEDKSLLYSFYYFVLRAQAHGHSNNLLLLLLLLLIKCQPGRLGSSCTFWRHQWDGGLQKEFFFFFFFCIRRERERVVHALSRACALLL